MYISSLVLIRAQIPASKDVCVFCLTRTQFASVHALRRPQRRSLSYTRAFRRPPANSIARKEEVEVRDSDSAWRSQPPRPFRGGWARTRTLAPSDLTPEEKALRNALQKESRREPPDHSLTSLESRRESPDHSLTSLESRRESPDHSLTSLEDGEENTTQGLRVPRTMSGIPGQTELTPASQIPTRMTRTPTLSPRQDDRLRDYPPAEASQVAPVSEDVEKNVSPRILESRSVTLTPPPPSESLLPRRPRSGVWVKKDITTELTPEEQALRKALQKGAAPKPHLPIQRISHSPHTSSVPGYPSRPDMQAVKDAHSETAHISPIQPSSTQRQVTQENTNNAGLPEHRQARDAQPNHPVSHTTAQEPIEHAKHWKHVRRVGHDLSNDHSQPALLFTQGRSGDTQPVARLAAIEREKMERMERTKGGEFVGLRDQYETATSKAMKYSHWSLETDESQVPDVAPTTTGAPGTSTTGNHLMKRRAQTATNSEEVADSLSENQRTTKLPGGWKRWKTPSADEQPPQEESSHRGRLDQALGLLQRLSTEIEREQIARKFEVSTRERERRTTREPQGQDTAKHSIYQSTSMPYARGTERDRARKNKKVISTYDDAYEEDQDHAARRMERKEQRKKARATQRAAAPATPIYLPEYISVSNLASVLKVRVEDFIHKMKDLGFEETHNDHVLDAETAGLVASEFNFEPIVEQAENQDLLPRPPAEDKSVLPPRPPVVTIMGHVDHGKTTLLDYLRKSSVAASEHGGITQHIGAFSVPMPGGRLVTFLDTPGHEAFLSMRQRGANVTDIVILVVAADDSVKPQTIEAIRHAQAAKVPMIVAVNKIDKEDSNVERVKQDLARYGVEIEDYGGETQVVCVSGKTGQGMEELEDAAVALADILDMRSETDGQAEGWVLEATTKKAGRVATVLVRRGTLKPGDIIVAGTSWARVRSLRNEAGVMLESAGPGTPAEIDGWREQPAAGDEVLQAPNEQRAKAVIGYRNEAYERTQMATDMAAVNEARRLEQEKREQLEEAAGLAETTGTTAGTTTEGQSGPSTPSFQEVFFVVKADVSGSVEAITDAVSALGNSEVRPHILRAGVGPVTEFDIDHAAVAKGHIITFNTTVDGNIQRMAEAKEVKILDQSIIYRLVDDVKAKLSEKLPSIVTQKVLGEAEIAQVFEINTKGRITVPFAGCKIRNGVVGRNTKIRVLRGKEVVYDGMLLHSPPLYYGIMC